MPKTSATAPIHATITGAPPAGPLLDGAGGASVWGPEARTGTVSGRGPGGPCLDCRAKTGQNPSLLGESSGYVSCWLRDRSRSFCTMISKPIALGLVAAACVAASAGGAYVAVRQNEPAPASPVATSEPTRTGKSEATVAETEAVITPTPAVEAVAKSSARTPTRTAAANRPSTPTARKESASTPVRPSAKTNESPRSSIPSAPDPAPVLERPSASRETPVAPPASLRSPPGAQRRRCQSRSLTCRPLRSRSSSRSSCRRRLSLDSTSRLRSRARRQRSKIASKRA